MEIYEITQNLEPSIRDGDLDSCIDAIIKELNKIPASPFHLAIDLDFINNPKDIAKEIEQFIFSEFGSYEMKALYTEMNGFSINPKKWYFELFAYDWHGGHDEYFWLSDWKSNEFKSITLSGMEALQNIYATDYVGNKKYGKSSGLSDFLVVLKFQKLIRAAGSLINNLNSPLLATAHDHELVYEYRKQA